MAKVIDSFNRIRNKTIAAIGPG